MLTARRTGTIAARMATSKDNVRVMGSTGQRSDIAALNTVSPSSWANMYPKIHPQTTAASAIMQVSRRICRTISPLLAPNAFAAQIPLPAHPQWPSTWYSHTKMTAQGSQPIPAPLTLLFYPVPVLLMRRLSVLDGSPVQVLSLQSAGIVFHLTDIVTDTQQPMADFIGLMQPRLRHFKTHN